MILVGWGRNAKSIAYMGISKCPNCRNWDHFQLFETKRKVTLYFVPVARFATHYYVVCNRCEAAAEVSKEKANEILRESIAVPSPDDASVIWKSLMDAASDDSLETSEQGSAALQERVTELESKYSKDNVEHVLAAFIGYVSDDDRPV